jgi:hypothetical protein
LYEAHGRALLAYACAFLHEPSEAEDVLHQVFVQPNLSTDDLGALRTTVAQIADALRLPPDRAREALAGVTVGSIPLPSPTRINQQRETIRTARWRVLEALAR